MKTLYLGLYGGEYEHHAVPNVIKSHMGELKGAGARCNLLIIQFCSFVFYSSYKGNILKRDMQ